MFLEIEHVAGNPPGDEEKDVGLEDCGMENNALESIEPMPEVVPAHEHSGEGIGDGKDKEIVVAQCQADIAVEKCMKGTLKTACRTKCPGTHAPWTLNDEMPAVGIGKVVKQPYENQDDRKRIGHVLVNLAEHRKNAGL